MMGWHQEAGVGLEVQEAAMRAIEACANLQGLGWG